MARPWLPAARRRWLLAALAAGFAGGARIRDGRGVPFSRLAAPSPPKPKPQPESWGLRLPDDLSLQVLGFLPDEPSVAWSFGGGVDFLPKLGHKYPPTRELVGHGGDVDGVTFAWSGAAVVAYSRTGNITIFDRHASQVWHMLQVERSDASEVVVYDVRAFQRGEEIAALATGGRVLVWSAASGQLLHKISVVEHGEHRHLRVFPDGGALVTGVTQHFNSSPAVVWDVASGAARHVLRSRRDVPLRQFEISPCGGKVVTAAPSGLFVWDASTGQLEVWLQMPVAGGPSIAVSWGAKTVAANQEHGTAVWDGTTGRLLAQLDMQAWHWKHKSVFLPGGDRLVVLEPQGASIWSIRRSRKVMELGGVPDEASFDTNIAISEDGEIIGACGAYLQMFATSSGVMRWVAFWNATTGDVMHRANQLVTHATAVALLHRAPMRTWERPCPIAVGPPSAMVEVEWWSS